ncbi:hypothetical protein LJR030_001511 [Rhizobium sp. LjRoot30]|uniref:hypothetical protein n=1 Tax=Rhizobium sp. LjRoot30 TaxID=3342320 RepID=UPI003ECC4060
MFDTKQIAKAIHLSEAAVRQWLSRSPDLALGHIDGHARKFDKHDAMTVVIGAEMLRHRLGRPHECFAAARRILATGASETWAFRPHGGAITTTSDRPEGAAVFLPIDFLGHRLCPVIEFATGAAEV